MTRFALFASILSCALLGAVASPAAAQEFPSRPITLVNPFPAGGGGDVLIRPLAKMLSDGLKQPVVVENRPGAGQTIGSAQVARAAPDGYTLLAHAIPTHVNVAAVYEQLPYDPIKSFTPIMQFAGGGSQILLVNPSIKAANLAELIALSKSRSDGLTYGSQGVGSLQHVIGELLRTESGISWTHVPFKGGAPALEALVGGHIDTLMTDSNSIPMIQTGKVRAIAVTSAKRLSQLPDVPTLAELGYPGATTEIGFALFAPAGTPAAVVARIQDALKDLPADATIQ
ncbi:MAG: Bug family tripartite tricarboxylate transporter substrate binding protein, partial [Burkholderiaceae bacterium]